MTRNERSPLGKRRETASLFVRDDTVAESLSMPETTETLERPFNGRASPVRCALRTPGRLMGERGKRHSDEKSGVVTRPRDDDGLVRT